MGRILAMTNVTLDGVMQAPGRPDEDRRGGFAHGGWAAPYAAMQHIGDNSAFGGGLLLGRRTYEDFHAVWPKRKESPFSAMLDNMPKFVASRTLREPLQWMNSTLLAGEAGDTVAAVKEHSDAGLLIMGSGDLIQSLIPRKLIDEFLLLIHPLVLGSGRRLFGEGGAFATLRLVGVRPTPNGVIIANYQPAA